MPIKFPGLAIREPLKRRPFAGAFVGLIAGAVFALLPGEGTFKVSSEAQAIGFLAGGVTAGAIIGWLAPQFRKRLTAGLSVWIGASCGLFVANRAWREFPEPFGSIVLGLIAGAVYSGAFWDYRAESPEEPK